MVVCWRIIFSECLQCQCSFLHDFSWLLFSIWALPHNFHAETHSVGVKNCSVPALGRGIWVAGLHLNAGLLQQSEISFLGHYEPCPPRAIPTLHLLWASTVTLLIWVVFASHLAEAHELSEGVLVNRAWQTVAQNHVTSSGLGMFIKSFGVLYFLSSTNLVSRANVIYGFVLCYCETCRILI